MRLKVSHSPILRDAKAHRRREQSEPRRIIDDLARREKLNLSEERKLLLRVRNSGDEKARERLVLSHLPLVISIAKEFQNRGLEREDLVQEGFVGLLDAINKFDHRGDIRFSAYATYRIRGCIRDAFREKVRTIKISRQLQARRVTLDKVGRKFASRTGRWPSVQELVFESGFTKEEVEEALSVPMAIESLNQLVGSDGLAELGELLPAEEVDELAGIGEDYGPLHIALAKLPPREELVLKLYYGFAGDPPTLKTIGDKIGVTESRASQIHTQALTRLLRRYPRRVDLEGLGEKTR